MDTLIVPLPSFLFLTVFATLAILASLRPSLPSITSRLSYATSESSFPKWLHILYIVLICAETIMTILEFVRLIIVQEGVGLLPANTVALISIAALLSWRGRQRNLLLAGVSDIRLHHIAYLPLTQCATFSVTVYILDPGSFSGGSQSSSTQSAKHGSSIDRQKIPDVRLAAR